MTKLKNIMLILLMFTFFIPFVDVHAESRTVTSEEQFLNAIKDTDVDTIILGSDINTTAKITITRPMYIDGKNHTMKYVGTFGEDKSDDNTVWGGIYVLQFYKTTGTLKNIKLTGANAGLLLNGSNVTFEGTVDVSGNGFGGIELGQGKGITETNKLALKDDAKIVNTTESKDKPTLWVPSDSADAVVSVNGESKTITSGDEITLTEFNTLFGIQNPQTDDTIGLYITLYVVSMVTVIEMIRKLKKVNAY